MKVLDTRVGETRLGLAYGGSIPEFIAANPGLVDYLELPFEQLLHTPALAALQDTLPFILHCASLSIAGFLSPGDRTVGAVAREAARTQTPWIGEHLAFVSADGLAEPPKQHEAHDDHDDHDRHDRHDRHDQLPQPTALTYTVCPQLSEETVARVADNLAALAPQLPAPLILENSPQYFPVPGSTMGMVDFIRAVVERSEVGRASCRERVSLTV